jgi:hypothetical protein
MKLKIALSLLTTAERKEFGRLLDAEFFGNQASIATCFHTCDALMSRNPDWTETDLSRALFPDKDPTAYIKYLRTRTSALLRALEAYLAWTSFRQDPVLQATCLVRSLSQRGWESGYRQAFATAMEVIDQAPLRGFGHYAARVELVEGIVDHAVNEPDRAVTMRIQEGLNGIDNSFYIRKLSLACTAVSLDRELQVSYRLGAIPSYEAWMADGAEPKEPLVHLYFLLFKITSDSSASSDSYYFQAKELLFQNVAALVAANWSEANDALRHLINYCVSRCNQKSELFKKELAFLYQASISSGILLYDKKVDALDFINAFKVFMLADHQGAISWLLSEFGNRIRGESSKATRHYCLGYQAQQDGHFESAGDHFLNALHAPPKTKRAPFEAELLAQIARAKFNLGDSIDAEYYARHLMRKIEQGMRLDASKTKSFKTFCVYLIALCQIQKTKPSRVRNQSDQLQHKFEAEQSPFFASQWIAKQFAQT